MCPLDPPLTSRHATCARYAVSRFKSDGFALLKGAFVLPAKKAGGGKSVGSFPSERGSKRTKDWRSIHEKKSAN